MNYNVNQISEMLDTSPETVRRWIRDGRLNAKQESRKTGNIISDIDLEQFLKTSPRYIQKKSSESIVLNLLPGLKLFSIGAAELTKIINSNTEENKIDSDQLKICIREKIAFLENSIEKRKLLLEQLQLEIEEADKQIKQYQIMINKLSKK